MEIVFFETMEEDELILSKILNKNKEINPKFIKEPLTEKNYTLAENAEVISIFLGTTPNDALLKKLPNLRLITTRSTGFDHIDLTAAKNAKIVVCNVPAYGSRTVAEFTFSLILGLSRKTFLAYKQIKNDHDFNISHFEGFDLQGKTIGVIGTGRIGQNVIKIANGFDMNVLGFDAFPNLSLEKSLNFKYKSLNDVLENSDIITLHVPYTPETKHLINKENISKIKNGAILINTSRGEVVDTESLLMALEKKTLQAVGLDVLEGEKDLKEEIDWIANSEKNSETHSSNFKLLLENHVLMNKDEVAITPHIAFFTKEAKTEILNTTVENIISFMNNNPINTVK